jgi:hypothetical protein
MLLSQNGYPVLTDSDHRLHWWVIPARNGHFKIRMRHGSAGFLLAHLILWISEVIEDMTGKVLDDWGWALRPVRGQTTGYSNHASGCAVDINSLKHPLGRRGTWLRWQYIKLRLRLLIYRGCIRMGIDYVNRPDEMHAEINKPLVDVERVARRLCQTKRGVRILHANPGQRKVIFS